MNETPNPDAPISSSDVNLSDIVTVVSGQSPVIATAIHDGHGLRDEVKSIIALDSGARLREEDPYTGIFASVATTQMVALRSRFEIDLNRPREKAVYRTPNEAWGLDIWEQELPEEAIENSLAEYDAFYAEAHRVLTEMERRFGRFIVFDLHSYNHRREGPDHAPEDPSLNPEVNVGTGFMEREYWAPVVDRFVSELSGHDFLGRKLDVRENVRFRGGHLSSWIHDNFPTSACCLAIEFKKFFMDEWTGKIIAEEYEAIPRALEALLPGVLEALDGVSAPAS